MGNLFEKEINRENTNSIKWDLKEELFQEEDVLPMWIADMDFKSPQFALDAISEMMTEGALGYTYIPDSLYEAIIVWQKKHHQMDLEKENIIFSPGVIPSLGLCIQAFTQPGESVLIHDPVYPPFAGLVEANGRKLVRSALKIEDNHYVMDLDDMEEKIVSENVKVFLLCHPHNPGGRVWTKEELVAVVELCREHDVIVVSDEIHGDLVFPGVDFFSPVALHSDYEDTVISLTSVTKTFNLAGIKNSMLFVFNEDLKEKIEVEILKTELNAVNTFGLVATEAVLTEGDSWLEELMATLTKNRQMVADFFDTKLPEVFYMHPEATYLCWFDVSSLGIPDEELIYHFAKVGKVGLNDGISYGPNGTQFMRVNFAAPPSLLKEGLARIETVFKANKS